MNIKINLSGKQTRIFTFTRRTEETDDVYLTGFENDEAYQSYLDMTKRIAIYDTGVEVTTADSVVTLSTCTSASDEHRFVVIGVKEQENQMGQTKN